MCIKMNHIICITSLNLFLSYNLPIILASFNSLISFFLCYNTIPVGNWWHTPVVACRCVVLMRILSILTFYLIPLGKLIWFLGFGCLHFMLATLLCKEWNCTAGKWWFLSCCWYHCPRVCAFYLWHLRLHFPLEVSNTCNVQTVGKLVEM